MGYIEKIRELFDSVDTDRSGTITMAELEAMMHSEEMQAYFEALELDASDGWTLFKLMDRDGSNVVDVEEFIMGCMRLRGSARNIDIAKLSSDHRWFMGHMSRRLKLMDARLGQLGNHLGVGQEDSEG